MKKTKGIARLLTKLPVLLAAFILLWGGMPVRAAGSKAIKSGTVVQVTADQALTYSTKTKNNVPNPVYYPLPKGTLDKVTGERISYKKGGKTYYYYNLASGLRISADDIKAVKEPAPKANRISGLSVKSDEHFTYITLATEQKVPYRVSYTFDAISFDFRYTTSTPRGGALENNPLFTSAKWKDGVLTLQLAKRGSYLGYRAEYNQRGNLVLRFINMPGSIRDLRIAIDAGHGGKDTGALGKDGIHEKHLNSAMAGFLAEELATRGAQVKVLDSDGSDGHVRRSMAEQWGADIFLNIHCNSASNKKATGTEVFYYRNANSKFAALLSEKVSEALNTNNRGAKKGIFHVSLSSQMASLLIETGFISNSGEFKKLSNEAYQKAIAAAIADAMEEMVEAWS